jgi:hypothetical protein
VVIIEFLTLGRYNNAPFPTADAANFGNVCAPVANALRGHFPNAPQVQQLLTMFDQTRRLQSR